MTIETEVAALATSVNVLTGQVNTSLSTLTNSATNAATSATNAETHKNSTSTLKTETGALKDLAVTAAGNAATAAASAYQDLAALAQSKSETAVDIFVYDTSKDSDGGAWRNRTQGTSWYNETLNVSNVRGARKDFPAVAVIVISAFDLKIYDGDDPAMPLWKNIGAGAGVFAQDGYSFESRCVTARDGKIVVGLYQVQGQISSEPGTYGGLIIFDYVADTSEKIRGKGSASNSGVKSGVNEVNWGGAFAFGYGTKILTYGWVNDVDMTVLPNAPIDANTGLPVPTIAAATREGTSVIKDDGTVVDITGVVTGTDLNDAFVFFNKDNYLFVGDRGSTYSRSFNVSGFKEMPATDVAITTANITYKSTNSSLTTPNAPYVLGQAEDMVGSSVGGLNGLTNLSHNYDTPSNSMVNYITDEYNTGWMNGDIKLATLVDTDDTNLAATELVVNNAFNDATGWSTSQTTEALQVVNGKLRVTEDGVADSSVARAYQQITTEVGKTYRVTADIDPVNTSTCSLNISNSVSTSHSINVQTSSTATTAEFYFTAESTSTYVLLTVNSATTVGSYADFDNVSVKEAVADRSHNSKALQVVGTVTKSAVATGAELVSFEGASGVYLEQPYNADLNFGYGDYCVMFWGKQIIGDLTAVFRGDANAGATGGAGGMHIWLNGSKLKTIIDGASQQIDTPKGNGSFAHYVVTRRNGTVYFYQDGVLFHTYDATTRNVSRTEGTKVLSGYYPHNNTANKLALLRISATAPTAEQIAKIYRDEEPLFRENAKCTLYGTVPYAAALAYEEDKDLLHVGTASGTSVFKGLQRVSNTTDATTVALSAAADIVAGE